MPRKIVNWVWGGISLEKQRHINDKNVMTYLIYFHDNVIIVVLYVMFVVDFKGYIVLMKLSCFELIETLCMMCRQNTHFWCLQLRIFVRSLAHFVGYDVCMFCFAGNRDSTWFCWSSTLQTDFKDIRALLWVVVTFTSPQQGLQMWSCYMKKQVSTTGL